MLARVMSGDVMWNALPRVGNIYEELPLTARTYNWNEINSARESAKTSARTTLHTWIIVFASTKSQAQWTALSSAVPVGCNVTDFC